ncbi:MAG: hypothetical protein EA412_12250 [Chitinophagaceae bacterium]|nr:MAG: hypothetical protein EA412_12250 [Chitinophagaceae bacterium]
MRLSTWKNITLSIIFLSFLAGNIHVVLIGSAYEINKEYIIVNLCKNQQQDDFVCDGLCYLKEQVEKTTSDESLQSPKINFLFFSEVTKNFTFYSTELDVLLPVYSQKDYAVNISIQLPPPKEIS